MKLFLAGKMVDGFYPSLRDLLFTRGTYTLNCDAIDFEDIKLEQDWPIIENCLVGGHDYTGPYRLLLPKLSAKHRARFHDSSCDGEHGWPTHDGSDYIVKQNQKGIEKADLVLAILTDSTCYGTFLDIGYAKGIGKPVATMTSLDDREFRYIHRQADYIYSLDPYSTPLKDSVPTAYNELIDKFNQSLLKELGQ